MGRRWYRHSKRSDYGNGSGDIATSFARNRVSLAAHEKDEIGFTQADDLYRHVSQLFRSDVWFQLSNEKTSGCLYLRPSCLGGSPAEVVSFGDSINRIAIKNEMYRIAKEGFGCRDLRRAKAYRNIFSIRIYPDEALADDLVRLRDCMDCVAHAFDAFSKAQVIGVIAHLDEDKPLHLHVLFRWDDKKPYGRCRMKDVLNVLKFNVLWL